MGIMLYMAVKDLFFYLYDDSNDCIFLGESDNVYKDYFLIKHHVGRKQKYLAYDYYDGGHYPNSTTADSKIRLPSIEETIKHFCANADLSLLLLCVDANELTDGTLTLLRYFKETKKPTKKNICIVIKSGAQLYNIAKVVSRLKDLRYIVPLELNTNVIGLNALTEWLTERKVLLTGNHPVPIKGISILGIPGTGKTVSAQLAAKIFNLPAYKFNIHTCLGKYVGDSEYNTELAFKEIKSLGKCVILLDEVDKIFNNNDDNQTTSRVLSILLNHMDNNKNVFWVLTGNNIKAIPPELLRKGRLDEYFYVGLPTLEAVQEYILYKFNLFEKYGFKYEELSPGSLIQVIAQNCVINKLLFSDIVSLCDSLYLSYVNNGKLEPGLWVNPFSSYTRYEEEFENILKWSQKNAKSAI